ncbi:MAG: radical SAM family heme chaperone HemW [Bacilli bacterium]|nr:radical SAM family heme chaperone HemW [Bacilli bacterium]
MIESAYIHIPFCTNICTYCDFCKMFYNKKMVNNYLLALEKEINSLYKNDILETIYIGGGTPSSFDIEDLNKLFIILRKLNKSDNIEYTIECNIENIDEEKLIFFKENGINRISIGIESFNEDILKFLGRKYTKKDIVEKMNIIKKYFDNINIDLIYAVPIQSIEILKEDLNNFIDLDIKHISTYSLIIEDNTKLKNDKIKYIDEDLDQEMYELIKETLKENNFIHYEISNFSKDTYQSKHNLNYWMNNNYYGFGLGASGFIDNKRYTNTRSINNYLLGKYILEEEYLDNEKNLENEIMLLLRTNIGLNKKELYNKYKIDIDTKYNIKEMIKDHLIEVLDNGNYIISKDKWYIENSILIYFIGGNTYGQN